MGLRSKDMVKHAKALVRGNLTGRDYRDLSSSELATMLRSNRMPPQEAELFVGKSRDVQDMLQQVDHVLTGLDVDYGDVLARYSVNPGTTNPNTFAKQMAEASEILVAGIRAANLEGRWKKSVELTLELTGLTKTYTEEYLPLVTLMGAKEAEEYWIKRSVPTLCEALTSTDPSAAYPQHANPMAAMLSMCAEGKHKEVFTSLLASYGVQFEGKAKGPPAKQAKQGYGSSPAKAKQGQDVCTHCHKLGHKAENCFKLHPDQRPQKKSGSTKHTE